MALYMFRRTQRYLVARDALRKSEESFQKGTPEDIMFGIMYRKIAKELLDA